MAVKSPIFLLITFLFTHFKIGLFHGLRFWTWLMFMFCFPYNSAHADVHTQSYSELLLQRLACVSPLTFGLIFESDLWVMTSASAHLCHFSVSQSWDDLLTPVNKNRDTHDLLSQTFYLFTRQLTSPSTY